MGKTVKVLSILAIIGIAVGGAFYAAGKRLQNLKLTLTSLTIDKKKLTLLYSYFNTGFNVANPNEEAVTIQKFVGEILYDGKKIADIDPAQNNGIVIPARGDKTLLFTTKVSNSALPGAIYKYLFGGSSAPMKAIIKGTLYAENMKISINEAISVK